MHGVYAESSSSFSGSARRLDEVYHGRNVTRAMEASQYSEFCVDVLLFNSSVFVRCSSPGRLVNCYHNGSGNEGGEQSH